MTRTNIVDGEFPLVYKRILANLDTEERWRWHLVKESDFEEFLPTYTYDDETITVYLPREYIMMGMRAMRKCMAQIIKSAYTNRPLCHTLAIRRFLGSPEYMTERRNIIKKELGITRFSVTPRQFDKAMALHPGLKTCLDSMAFTYCDRKGRYITRTDYISRTILIPKEVFEYDDEIMKVYVVYRELATCVATHPMRKGPSPVNTKELMRFITYYPNWERCEERCKEMGWVFRYPLEESDAKDGR